MTSGNPFDDMRRAISDAELMLLAADGAAESIARLLRGRLRCVRSRQGIEALRALKRELRDFNITTGEWKP